MKGERVWGCGRGSQILLQLSPRPPPGHFLAEGGPRRQTVAGDSLGQAHKEESPGVWVAGAGNGFLGRHPESESSWGRNCRPLGSSSRRGGRPGENFSWKVEAKLCWGSEGPR